MTALGDTLAAYARMLGLVGPEAAQAATALAEAAEDRQLTLLPENPEAGRAVVDVFQVVTDELRSGWRDTDVAALLAAIRSRLLEHRLPDPRALARWLQFHRGDAGPVLDCLSVEPPEGFSILRLLSKAGSQKVVYLATWGIAQREVVLKRLVGGDADKLILRELQPHPLSMTHSNIIETHRFDNRDGEPFLVEERLPVVLSDKWQSDGIQEAANLLRDIANALAFLELKGLIHGDIKPDNIGFEDGRYILLDFGICRPAASFTKDTSATGSLRTRAPELLTETGLHTAASDVWALGATVFNSFAHRFPLFGAGELPPRVSTPEERKRFEDRLADRARTQWSLLVDVSVVPEPLQNIVRGMLEQLPNNRPKPSDIARRAEAELAAFLRSTDTGGTLFSPTDEIDQLSRHLPDASVLKLMPKGERQAILEKLDRLSRQRGISASHTEMLDSIRRRLA